MWIENPCPAELCITSLLPSTGRLLGVGWLRPYNHVDPGYNHEFIPLYGLVPNQVHQGRVKSGGIIGLQIRGVTFFYIGLKGGVQSCNMLVFCNTVNVNIFVCINFRKFTKIGNFMWT